MTTPEHGKAALLAQPSRRAFLVRVKPLGQDRVPIARETSEITVGWGKADGLLDETLSRTEFAQRVASAYGGPDASSYALGQSIGHLWRFAREMHTGDLVVVPHGDTFHVGVIIGDATYDPASGHEHWAYRRPVRWLNARPIPRQQAGPKLRRPMRSQGTTADISKALDEIRDLIT